MLVSVGKLILVIALSLWLNNWWTFSGSKYNDDMVSECSSTEISSCGTFCDNNVTVTLVTVSDDLVGLHDATGGYCAVSLPQSCAYDYWLIFRLVPICLHILMVALQFMCLFKYKEFVPQQLQYNVIAEHWFGITASPVELNDSSPFSLTAMFSDYTVHPYILYLHLLNWVL